MVHARKKRVLIADDHTLLAEGIARFLSADYEVVGVVSDGRQLVTEGTRLRPDLIVLDISMPLLNGIEAARQLRKAVPATKLIFVTQQIELQYLRAAFHAGGMGYVAKQSASDELLEAVRSVLNGGTYITRSLQEKVDFAPVSELRRDEAGDASGLTTRQREVLQMVAEGKTSREIAAVLRISAKTVEFHKKSLMDQTGLRTAVELTRYAIATGVVSL